MHSKKRGAFIMLDKLHVAVRIAIAVRDILKDSL